MFIIFSSPKYAVLDEASSSLPEEVEKKLYEMCKEKKITLISVGHRSTLKKYHNMLLWLEPNQRWMLEQISNKL